MKYKQSGFTLIEIAIVLVIVGLLLGGVLKGLEFMNSAKVKSLATDFRNIPEYIYGYHDMFMTLPGDDRIASTHLASPSGVTITDGDGNGIINGAWNATTGESFQFWQHVRLAGFSPGAVTPGTADYIPTNAVGGRLGVTNVAEAPISGMHGSYVVCSGSIPGKFAKQIDITLDDGNTATGSVMVAAAGTLTAVPTLSVNDDLTYIECIGY